MSDRRDRDRDRDRERDRYRDRKRIRDDRERDRARDRSRRSRSRTPDRTRSRHTRSRTRSPDERDRHRHQRPRSRSPTSPPRKRHKDDVVPKDKHKDEAVPKDKKQKVNSVASNDEGNKDGDLIDEDEMEMMKKFGIPTGFDSSKGKPVAGNDVGAVRKVTKRQPRQYMNRRGGFNRPLPAEVNR